MKKGLQVPSRDLIFSFVSKEISKTLEKQRSSIAAQQSVDILRQKRIAGDTKKNNEGVIGKRLLFLVASIIIIFIVTKVRNYASITSQPGRRNRSTFFKSSLLALQYHFTGIN